MCVRAVGGYSVSLNKIEAQSSTLPSIYASSTGFPKKIKNAQTCLHILHHQCLHDEAIMQIMWQVAAC
jgi:hypothetical protein